MIARARRGGILLVGLGALLVGHGGAPASAQQESAVLGGVQYLRAHAAGQNAGESAMIALAMLKAEVPHGDPVLSACLAKVRSRFTSSAYIPERNNGQGAYEAGASAMALASQDAVANRGYLAMIASYLTANQNANGSWDYTGRTSGDTSITQYAVLGLWEAESAGIEVPPGGLGPDRLLANLAAERRRIVGLPPRRAAILARPSP